MTLGQFTEPRLLIPRLLADRPDQAVRELAARLESCDRIGSARRFADVILAGEDRAPSLAARSVAVPHARGGDVQKLSVAVGIAPQGIFWDRNSGEIVNAVFLFAVPLIEAGRYLSLLSGLSALIHDEMAFSALTRATQPEEMLEVLRQVRLARVLAEPAILAA
jgi:PTS system fructose-specific IIC component/PTS system nitrogen regulatory IIA component